MHAMLKTRTAQWILAQVLPEENARAAIGDWLEDTPTRGDSWFWGCVFGTFVATVGRRLAENPLEMARLGSLGFARNFFIGFTLCAFLFFALLLTQPHVDIRIAHSWLLINTETNPLRPPQFELRWGIEMAIWLIYATRQFLTGRWLARRAPGREVAACVSVAAFG